MWSYKTATSFRNMAAGGTAASLFLLGICLGYGGAEFQPSTLPLKRDETCISCILVNALTPGNVQL